MLLLKVNPLTHTSVCTAPSWHNWSIRSCKGMIGVGLGHSSIVLFAWHMHFLHTVMIFPYGKQQAQLCTSPCSVMTNIRMLNFQIQTWEMATSQLYPLHLVNLNSELLRNYWKLLHQHYSKSKWPCPPLYVRGGGGEEGACVCAAQTNPCCVSPCALHTIQSDVCCIKSVGCVKCVGNSSTCVDLNTLSTSALHKTCWHALIR